MPESKKQRFLFAFITVFITVHCFVWYNVAIENVRMGFGVSINMLGYTRIGWYVLIEFICALTCELLIGAPFSAKLALKVVKPNENKPFLVETAIICCTVAIMCPLMSFLAEFIYDCFFPLIDGTFNAGHFFANFFPRWFQKVVLNFPFALLMQLFYIQPLVRTIFKGIVKVANKRKSAESVAVPELFEDGAEEKVA